MFASHPRLRSERGRQVDDARLCLKTLTALSLLVLLTFSMACAQTEQTASLTCDLATCIQLALSRHPDLQVVEARRLAAQSKVEFEKAQWRPQLDLKGESGFLSGKAVSPFAVTSKVTEEGIPQREVSSGFYLGSVSLSLPLVKEGRLLGLQSPSIQQARFALAAEESLQSTRREQIIYNVTAAYLNALKALEMVKNQEQVVTLTESQYQLALSQFKQNLIARNDLLLAEVQLTATKRDLIVARNAHDQARHELARAVGLDAPATVETRDPQVPSPITPPPPSLAELLSFAYQHRPEIKAQQAQIQAQQEDVKRLQGERYPTLGVITAYNMGNAIDPSVSAQSVSTNWQASVQLSAPLFDFGRQAQKISISRALVTQEVSKMESLKGQIAGEIQDVYTRIVNTRAQLELSDKQIEQATEALKLSRAKFAQQLLPESALAAAQVTLVNFEQAKTLATYDLSLAYRQLELVTGGWKAQAR
jgi:outer membrane protein